MSLAKKKIAVDDEAKKDSLNYSEIVQSPKFQELLKAKKAFIIPMSLFFFVFYFSLPLMTSFSKVLNTQAFGSVTWAWLFAFAQFFMTWALCILYSKKAQSYDKKVNEILTTIKKGR